MSLPAFALSVPRCWPSILAMYSTIHSHRAGNSPNKSKKGYLCSSRVIETFPDQLSPVLSISEIDLPSPSDVRLLQSYGSTSGAGLNPFFNGRDIYANCISIDTEKVHQAKKKKKKRPMEKRWRGEKCPKAVELETPSPVYRSKWCIQGQASRR